MRWTLTETDGTKSNTLPKASNPDLYVNTSGTRVDVLIRDGLDVIYKEEGVEKEGRIGKDVKIFETLPLDAALKLAYYLPKHPNGNYRFAIKTEHWRFAVVHGQLGVLCSKKGGYTLLHATCSVEECLDLAAGKKTLKYTKGTNNFRVA